jgi:hypothetical protein
MPLPVMQTSCGDRCKCRKPDSRLVEALRAELTENCRGKEHAATWDELLGYLNRYPYALEVRTSRRLQEAAELLREEGYPVVGLSSGGVFMARTVDELDEAIAENDKRARKSLRKRRLLRRVRARMLGQVDLSTEEAA